MKKNYENKSLEQSESVTVKSKTKKFMFPTENGPVVIEAKNREEAESKFNNLNDK